MLELFFGLIIKKIYTMPKQVIVNKANIDKRVEIVSRVIYGSLPPAELSVLQQLVKCAENNSLHLSPEATLELRNRTSLSTSGFSTAIARLEKKNILSRQGRSIILNPYFKGIDTLDMLNIVFSETLS